MGQMNSAHEILHMRRKIFGNRRISDRRSDGGNLEAPGIHPLFDLFDFLV